jgi:hypothetical protein
VRATARFFLRGAGFGRVRFACRFFAVWRRGDFFRFALRAAFCRFDPKNLICLAVMLVFRFLAGF